MIRSLLMVFVAMVGAWAEESAPAIPNAQESLAHTRDHVTLERRKLDLQLAELAKQDSDLDAQIETASRDLAAPSTADPAPAVRELHRAVETLIGGPAEDLNAALSSWSKGMIARLAQAGSVSVHPGRVTQWNGRQVDGQVVTLGLVETASAAPRACLVTPYSGGWRQVGPEVHADDPRGWIPVDVTGKLAAQPPSEDPSLLSRLRSGGLFVIPILGTGLLALALVIERLLSFRRNAVDDEMADTVVRCVEADDVPGAQRALTAKHCLTSRVLGAGLAHVTGTMEDRTAAMGEIILAAGPSVERNITILGMLAAAAPLLGLLGTVSGMIAMFHVLAIHGTGNPRLLSGGISKALICTQLGLLMAVPILFAHAFLSRRVERTFAVIEKQATALARARIKPRPEPSHAA